MHVEKAAIRSRDIAETAADSAGSVCPVLLLNRLRNATAGPARFGRHRAEVEKVVINPVPEQMPRVSAGPLVVSRPSARADTMW